MKENRFLAKKENPQREVLLGYLATFKFLQSFGGVPTEMNCNAFIIDSYKKENKGTIFRTYKQWFELGFVVKKGEKGLPLFSSPKTYKPQNEATEATEATDSETKHVFFISYVFSDLQVNKLEPPSNHISGK